MSRLAVTFACLLLGTAMATTFDDQGNVYDDGGDVSLLDGYGTPVMDGTGFGEAVEDQLTTGVPNGLFAHSDVDAQTSDYWTKNDPAEMLTVTADAALAGGYYWRFSLAAEGTTGLQSTLFPVSGNRWLIGALTRPIVATAIGVPRALIRWYDEAGDVLGATTTVVLPPYRGTDGWYDTRALVSNPNATAAHYASVEFQVFVDTGFSNPADYIDLAGVSFLPAASSAAPSAYQLGGSPSLTYTSSVNGTLAPGDILAIPMQVPGPFWLYGVALRQGSTASARTAEWRLYQQRDISALTTDWIVGTKGTFSFTPGAVSNEVSALDSNASCLFVPAGVVWLVIRNSHATNAFVVRSNVAGQLSVAGPRWTNGGALGATYVLSNALDMPDIFGIALVGCLTPDISPSVS